MSESCLHPLAESSIFTFSWDCGQPDLNHQTAFASIAGLDSSTMQTNGAFRDGQAQSDATGLPAASVIDAIERPKQFVERFSRHTRTRIRNLDDSFRFTRSLFALQTDLDVRTFTRV